MRFASSEATKKLMMSAAIITPAMAAAKVTHFSCWRSSPVARFERRRMAAAASTSPRPMNGQPMDEITSKRPNAPSTPTGLITESNGASK